MSALYYGYPPEAGPAPAPPAPPWVTRDDLRAGAFVVACLGVLGVVLGIVWELWSRHSSQVGSRGFVTASGVIPDEKEGFIAGDARFVILTGAVGLVAGLVAWSWRARRGPLMPVALAVGGLLGAALTAIVGHALATGRTGGPANSVIVIKLSLHAYGLAMIEAALALLVYLVGVLVIKPDDLGRPAPPAPYPGSPYPGSPYPGSPYPGSPYPGSPYPPAPHPGSPYPGPPSVS